MSKKANVSSSDEKRNKANWKKNSKRKGKGNKTWSGKDERSGAQFSTTPEASKVGSNDIQWYTRYPHLTVASASIPFPYRPGMKLNLNPINVGTTATTPDKYYTIPGVLGLQWVPTIGVSERNIDPASLVGLELYARIRSKYSSELDVDGPDLVVYLVCLDSIYSNIAFWKRAYRLVNAYTPNNYNYPDSLLKACGLGDDTIASLRKDKTKLWQYINEWIHMVSVFRCPAEFDFMNRHYWMNDNVFTDADTAASQVYLFAQNKTYQYEAQATPDGPLASGATLTRVVDANDTVDTINTHMRGLIQRLTEWSDSYTINGYLARAFEDANFFTIDILQQDEQVIPVYSPEVLMQIENITLPPADPISSTRYEATISQDPGTNAILCNPTLTYMPMAGNGEFQQQLEDLPELLNVHSDAPTVADTVIATRLHPTFNRISVSDSSVTVQAYGGTELITRLFYSDTGHAGVMSQFMKLPYDLDTPSDLDYSWLSKTVKDLSRIGAFSQHPIMWLLSYSQTEAGGAMSINYTIRPLCELHNLTVVDKRQLNEIHRICLLSEWNAYNVL